jgi:hypothetical protein
MILRVLYSHESIRIHLVDKNVIWLVNDLL